jgi:uncharacterized protein YndB with AHSA1/START domain
MTANMKTIEINIKRMIPAAAAEVYDAWLDPQCDANPWHGSARLDFTPKVNGLYYFLRITDEGNHFPHYGRFVVLDRPRKIQLHWMSKHTEGLESVVTVDFVQKGEDTLLSINHANLPDSDKGRMHETGWNHFLGQLEKLLTPQRA